MFLVTWNNKDAEMFANEEILVAELRRISISLWPSTMFKQIDRNNLRRVEVSFDAAQDVFTFKTTKVSR